MEKIKNFTDLNTWKEAHKLVLMVYTHTKNFPDEERFGLTNQSRRAAVSVSSNIAEGFGRSSARDKRHFYTMGATSLAELQNQFLAARDLEYIQEEFFETLATQMTKTGMLLSGLIKSATNKAQ
ncbi:MAG TPA: four helix bundle protein [Candidatus Paceibacterota bacterium]